MREPLVHLCGAAFLLLVGCSGGDASDCVGDETECDGACVLLSYSAAHCGACGNACACDEQCVDGACAPVAGGAMVEVGTLCDPEATPDACVGGAPPSGSGPLACDAVEAACAAACTSDADCRNAGLGYVCDTRALEDVDARFAGEAAPRNVCVNRACF